MLIKAGVLAFIAVCVWLIFAAGWLFGAGEIIVAGLGVAFRGIVASEMGGVILFIVLVVVSLR